MGENADVSYIAEQVRLFDNDRYLCALFAPADRRDSLFALYAFNLEVAKTREAVSESTLGRIRLQWWRETVESIYAGSPRRHEVALALARAVERHNLPRARLDALIDARELDLEDRPPRDMDELVCYARATSAELVALGLEVLDARTAPAAEAGEHVGVAWALTGLIRALPFHARGRRVYLPEDRMTAAGLDLADYWELRPSKPLAAVVGQVASAARERLSRARARAGDVPRAAVPALLPAVMAEAWLARLARAGYDPFEPRLAVSGAGRALRVAAAARRGRY